jgi:tRNA wybutosine-synthesizing protein 4
MDFQAKNFSYVTKAFGDFIEQADAGARLYLRSLSSENPSQLPADIKRDFPSISNDFRLPPELAGVVIENFHSAPLRISGPVIMWLHYDVRHLLLIRSPY